MAFLRPVFLRRICAPLLLIGLLHASPGVAITFGEHNGDLIPQEQDAEGLDLLAGMLELAVRLTAEPRLHARPVQVKLSADVVALPEGGVAIGSHAEKGNAAEHPRHWVQLDAFAIDRTEVTRAAYQRCVAAGKCGAPELANVATPTDDAHPVTGVRWQDAADYCAFAGKRLPSEAEWEYAARSAGRDQAHPWGDELANCRRAWMTQAKSGCDTQHIAVPCSVAGGTSAQGVCDLIGNVWEWTADWYGPYHAQPQWNPRGPEHGMARVVRGGSWLEFVNASRAAARAPRLPETRAPDLGFRCVTPLGDEAAVAFSWPTPQLPSGDRTAWDPATSPRLDSATGLAYVWIAGGSFHFGCEPADSHCFADERPGNDAQVTGFWLSERDATAAQYQRCVDAGVCGPADLGGSCTARLRNRADHPANCVSWYQSELFCAWAGARLPSVVEWEYAAKGGEARIFPWGNEPPNQTRANYCDKRCGALHPDWLWPDKTQDDGWSATSPVGAFPAGASRQGLLDMVGNAAQWTSTPMGLPARQVRGGGWDLYARYLRNTARTSLPPSHWFDNVTIRCAR